MKNIPLYFGSSMKENRKGHKTYYFTKSHMKDKDELPSYKDILYRVSTDMDTKNQSDEKPPQ